MPTIKEDPQHEGEEEAEQPKSPPTTSAPAITAIFATPPPASQALLVSSPLVEIFVHPASTSLTTLIMVLYSSLATTSPFSSASLPPPFPTLSTVLSSITTTIMPPLTLPKAFAKYMLGIPVELSRGILNPVVQVVMSQNVVGLPIPPPPTEPPKMEATMQISEEMEK